MGKRYLNKTFSVHLCFFMLFLNKRIKEVLVRLLQCLCSVYSKV